MSINDIDEKIERHKKTLEKHPLFKKTTNLPKIINELEKEKKN